MLPLAGKKKQLTCTDFLLPSLLVSARIHHSSSSHFVAYFPTVRSHLRTRLLVLRLQCQRGNNVRLCLCLDSSLCTLI